MQTPPRMTCPAGTTKRFSGSPRRPPQDPPRSRPLPDNSAKKSPTPGATVPTAARSSAISGDHRPFVHWCPFIKQRLRARHVTPILSPFGGGVGALTVYAADRYVSAAGTVSAVLIAAGAWHRRSAPAGVPAVTWASPPPPGGPSRRRLWRAHSTSPPLRATPAGWAATRAVAAAGACSRRPSARSRGATWRRP